MGAIADTLTEAGHNVTLLMPIIEIDQQDKTGVKLTKNIIKLPPSSAAVDFLRRRKEIYNKLWTMQPSMLALMQMSQNMTRLFKAQCKKIVSDVGLLKQLKDERFDLGLAEAFNICGFGIFELANIPASIATSAAIQFEAVSKAIGEPLIPSYVPGEMTAASDHMNLMERFNNFIGVFLGQKFFEGVFDSETEVLRKQFGQDFKGWEQLLSESSFVFTNANPYLDYPRPMLHKTVPVGGVAVSIGSKENELSEEWIEILNKRNKTVLVSFGSMARAIYMPKIYMNALLTVFGSMPDTTFIMKYEEKNSKIAAHLPNVYLSPWLPQNALLADPRLTAFITHGGLASTTELAHQGKPAILVPLFADQPRNAQMLAKHGGAIVLTKYDLDNPKKLLESLHAVLNDPRYAQNAKRLSEMLLNQPINAKELVVRHCEFAARFGRLPNLDTYGRQLSFVHYYLLDIIAVLVAVFLLITYVSFLMIRKCFSFAVKPKKD